MSALDRHMREAGQSLVADEGLDRVMTVAEALEEAELVLAAQRASTAEPPAAATLPQDRRRGVVAVVLTSAGVASASAGALLVSPALGLAVLGGLLIGLGLLLGLG